MPGIVAAYQTLVSDPNFHSDADAQQLASQLQAKAAPIYQSLVSDPNFGTDTDAQQMAHQFRASGIVQDPTQGGTVTPQPVAAPVATGGASTAPQSAPSAFDQQLTAMNPQEIAPALFHGDVGDLGADSLAHNGYQASMRQPIPTGTAVQFADGTSAKYDMQGKRTSIVTTPQAAQRTAQSIQSNTPGVPDGALSINPENMGREGQYHDPTAPPINLYSDASDNYNFAQQGANALAQSAPEALRALGKSFDDLMDTGLPASSKVSGQPLDAQTNFLESPAKWLFGGSGPGKLGLVGGAAALPSLALQAGHAGMDLVDQAETGGQPDAVANAGQMAVGLVPGLDKFIKGDHEGGIRDFVEGLRDDPVNGAMFLGALHGGVKYGKAGIDFAKSVGEAAPAVVAKAQSYSPKNLTQSLTDRMAAAPKTFQLDESQWQPMKGVDGGVTDGTNHVVPSDTGATLYGPGGTVLGEYPSIEDAQKAGGESADSSTPSYAHPTADPAVEKSLVNAGVAPDEAPIAALLLAQKANVWSETTGKPASEYPGYHDTSFVAGGKSPVSDASTAAATHVETQSEVKPPPPSVPVVPAAKQPPVVGVQDMGGTGNNSGSLFQRDSKPQTNTPEFKRWFGDSKIVDDSGKPTVMYHGTGHGGFSEFSHEDEGDNLLYGQGAYFTDNPEIASGYAETTHGKFTDEDYSQTYRPGSIVKSYGGGYDRVISYDPKTRDVTAIRVNKDGSPVASRWGGVTDERPRTYMAGEDAVKAAITKRNSVYPVHISMQHPLEINKPISKSDYDSIVKARQDQIKGFNDGLVRHAAKWGGPVDKYGGFVPDTKIDQWHAGMTGADAYKNLRNEYRSQYSSDGNGKSEANELLKNAGFDGITHIGGNNVGRGKILHNVAITFDPKQIKSAIGNRGTFDPSDPNILFQRDSGGSRRTDGLGFYSHAERVVEDKMGGKMGVPELRKMLENAGVKPDEMHWSGLNDLLDEHKGRLVTKQEVLDHLRQGNVQLLEVVKGNDLAASKNLAKAQKALDDYRSLMISKYGKHGHVDANDISELEGNHWNKLHDAVYDADRAANDKEPTRYDQYQLPGGKNYREMLMTLPEKDTLTHSERMERFSLQNRPLSPAQSVRLAELNKKAFLRPDPYSSSHWDEPNVLAHIRTSDRTGPNGEKILHVEEVQSDWHQAGRKQGYIDPKYRAKLEDELAPYGVKHGNRSINTLEKAGAPKELISKWFNEYMRGGDAGNADKIPSAPFSKTWHELSSKRILRYAAEHGYDKVAWTPGDIQNDRYSLHHQVDRVEYHEDKQELKAYKSGNDLPVVKKDGVKPSDLPDIIGKDVADRMMSQDKSAYGTRRLTGEQLKIGGSGMKGFYDKILPDTFNKLGKRFGAKVGETDVKTGRATEDEWLAGKKDPSATLHSIPITDDMRKSLTTEGQPLFQHANETKGEYIPGRGPTGGNLIKLYKGHNFSTIVHEIMHMFTDRRNNLLSDADHAILESKTGFDKATGSDRLPGSDAWRDHHEKVARWYEQYLTRGTIPARLKELRPIFDKIKDFMLKVYQSVKGEHIDDTLYNMAGTRTREGGPRVGLIPDEVSSVFDRMLAGEKVPEEAFKAKDGEDPTGSSSTAATTGDSAESTASGKSGAPKSKPNVIGSINLDHTGLTPDANTRLVAIVKQLGLDKKPVATDADARQGAAAIGLNYDDVRNWITAKGNGHVPPNAGGLDTKAWRKTWELAIRDLNAKAINENQDAKFALDDATDAYSADKTAANKRAVDVAKQTLDRADDNASMMTRENSELGGGSGASLQGRKQNADSLRVASANRTLSVPETWKPAKAQPTQSGSGKSTPKAQSRRQPKNPISDADFSATMDRLNGANVLRQESSGSDTSPRDTTLRQSSPPSITPDEFRDNVDDFTKIGAYRLHGAKNEADWFTKVKTDLPRLTDPQLHDLWNKSKIAYDAAANKGQVTAAKRNLMDGLIPLLGSRQAVSDFVDQVNDEDPNIMDKWFNSQAFTPDEKDTFTRAMSDNKLDKTGNKPNTPAQGPVKVAQEIAKEIRDAAKTSKSRVPGSPKVLTPEEQFARSVSLRVNAGAADRVIARLRATPDGQAAYGNSAGELTREQARAFADALRPDMKPTNKRQANAIGQAMTNVMRDSKSGKLGTMTAKQAVDKHFLEKYTDEETERGERIDRSKSDTDDAIKARMVPIRDALAKITDDGDWGKIKEVVNKFDNGHGNSRFWDNVAQYYRGNLLSNTATLPAIIASHVLSASHETNIIDPMVASWDKQFVDRVNARGGRQIKRGQVYDPSDVRASLGKVGSGVLSAGRTLVHGEMGETLRSVGTAGAPSRPLRSEFNLGFDKVADKVQSAGHAKTAAALRALNTALNAPTRTFNRQHGAAFNVVKEPVYDYALRSAARLQATNEGFTGKDLDDRAQELYNAPTLDMEEKAELAEKGRMFTNDNQFTTMLNRARANRLLRPLIDLVFPIDKVPVNIASNAAEHSPFGILYGLSKIMDGGGGDFVHGFHMEDMTPEDRVSAMRSIVRGVIGTAVGALAATYAAKAGIHGLDEKHYRYSASISTGGVGSKHLGGRRTDIGRFQPWGSPVTAGETLKEQVQNHTLFTLPGGADALKSLVGEAPYTRVLLGEMMPEGGGGANGTMEAAGKLAARYASGFIPGSSLQSAWAAQFDPSHSLRKQSTGWDVLAHNLPTTPGGGPSRLSHRINLPFGVTIPKGQALNRQALPINKVKVGGGDKISIPESAGLSPIRGSAIDSRQLRLDAKDDAAIKAYVAKPNKKKP